MNQSIFKTLFSRNKHLSIRRLISIVLISASMLTGHAFAEVLPVPLSAKVTQSDNTPKHGIDMQRVEEKFGEPLEKMDAVGEPPITRWVYPTFTVFFEYDKVLHSVVHRS